jgi:hypothetical protein
VILAIVAGVFVGGLALSTLFSRGDESGSGLPADEDGSKAVSVAPAGAPPGLSVDELSERYDPVLDAGLFTKRSFKARPKRGPKKPREKRQTSRPKGPTDISLRLTGLIGSGEDRRGVLEEPGSGQGLLAAAGKKLGATDVAEINTSSLVLSTEGNRRELTLGDTFELPAKERSTLIRLRPKPAPDSVKSGGKTPAIELSDDKRMTILERLKARRKSSMTSKKDSDDESN